MSCGTGRRHSSDPVLLWLWHRLSAVALIQPLAWKPPYVAGMARKDKNTYTHTHTHICMCVYVYKVWRTATNITDKKYTSLTLTIKHFIFSTVTFKGNFNQTEYTKKVYQDTYIIFFISSAVMEQNIGWWWKIHQLEIPSHIIDLICSFTTEVYKDNYIQWRL